MITWEKFGIGMLVVSEGYRTVYTLGQKGQEFVENVDNNGFHYIGPSVEPTNIILTEKSVEKQ